MRHRHSYELFETCRGLKVVVYIVGATEECIYRGVFVVFALHSLQLAVSYILGTSLSWIRVRRMTFAIALSLVWRVILKSDGEPFGGDPCLDAISPGFEVTPDRQ